LLQAILFWAPPLVEWIAIQVAGLDPTRKVSRDRIESATRNPYEESYSKGLTAYGQRLNSICHFPHATRSNERFRGKARLALDGSFARFEILHSVFAWEGFFTYFETIPSGAKMGCLLLYSNTAGIW
jgi:hypothetical protein